MRDDLSKSNDLSRLLANDTHVSIALHFYLDARTTNSYARSIVSNILKLEAAFTA